MDILQFGKANGPSEGPAVYSFKSWGGEAGSTGRMVDKQCVIIVNQAFQHNMYTYTAFWMSTDVKDSVNKIVVAHLECACFSKS